MNELLKKITRIAKQAGDIICDIYYEDAFTTSTKKDTSPLTNADILSNRLILEGLQKIDDTPILSEEDIIPYVKRQNSKNL